MSGSTGSRPTVTHKVFIDGAAGTTGLEIAERLTGREEFEVIALDESRRKDEGSRREALNEADVAILCLPDEAARDAVALVDPASGTRLIDASSAHRTSEGWCYGFPEIVGRERVAEARRVSNPGCYPTGFLALVAPLVREGLLPADRAYSVHAVSGYSGGGKALIQRFEGGDRPAFRAYALGMGHKHVGEMQHHAGLARAPLFSPAVVDTFRGMVVEVPLMLGSIEAAAGPFALRDALKSFYAGSVVVRVHGEIPQAEEIILEAAAEPRDDCELFVFGSADGTQARLIARLDNLGKGASGAAVQNLNLMCGLPETAGLRLPAA